MEHQKYSSNDPTLAASILTLTLLGLGILSLMVFKPDTLTTLLTVVISLALGIGFSTLIKRAPVPAMAVSNS